VCTPKNGVVDDHSNATRDGEKTVYSDAATENNNNSVELDCVPGRAAAVMENLAGLDNTEISDVEKLVYSDAAAENSDSSNTLYFVPGQAAAVMENLAGLDNTESSALNTSISEKVTKLLEKEKADRKAHRKKVAVLIFAKLSGNLLESFLSFSLVSYYLVIGTVSDHQDVERPTPFVYVAWAASLVGMFYKGVSAMIILNETDIPKAVPIVIISWLVLIALLPATLIAEDRYGIHTTFFPEVTSIKLEVLYKLAVYSVIWGTAMTICMICRYCHRYIAKGGGAFLLFINLIIPYTLWLSLTQFSIHSQGKFRTEIGELLCLAGSIAASVLFIFCSAGMLVALGFDIAVIFKPSILNSE